MARYTGGHRDMKRQRGTLVKGNLCPGMWVEDPQITLLRNIEFLLKRWQKSGKTINDFTRVSGVPHSTLVHLRKGRAWPEPGTLMKIASTFGVPIEVLFRR